MTAAGEESGEGVPLDVITWHIYTLGSGNSTNVPAEIMNATYLNSFAPKCSKHHTTVEHYAGPDAPQLWIGEGGGAYGSGQDGSTNTFMSTFWYGDSLGTMAVQGHDAMCRQALVGGNYALLNLSIPYEGGQMMNGGAGGAGGTGGEAKDEGEGQGEDGYGATTLSMSPNPDMYTAIMWRHIMGDTVLEAWASGDTNGTATTATTAT
eukprot:CAMPEP_0119493604 /NCGR_PEP_ID=MMETSP1344-20130328/17812_1 /TAXON_ID=236787 /ORGANISM="Florenciella parvula, Strain CCMP2471" /LENGTH=206 /DNA_ID=CAMNT_0007529043 /DNA_START=85 /DNA_END=702 /DNA_ORIENTATION=+